MSVSVIVAKDPGRSWGSVKALGKAVELQMNELGISFEFLVNEEGSKSSARNSAAFSSEGDFLLFLDDDVQLRRNFLREIFEPFEDPEVGAVGGVNLAPPDIQGSRRISAVLMSSPLMWFRSVARYTPRGGIRETDEAEIIGCCLAVRRIAFNQAGGFPLDVIPCEENVMIERLRILGWKVIYNPFAVVFHERAPFPGGYARKVFGYGEGRGIMLRRSLTMGSPRMLWKPSRKWISYFLGFWIHHFSYFAGVFYGYFIKRKYQERDDKK